MLSSKRNHSNFTSATTGMAAGPVAAFTGLYGGVKGAILLAQAWVGH